MYKSDWIQLLHEMVTKIITDVGSFLNRDIARTARFTKSDGDPATEADLLGEDIAAEILRKSGLPVLLFSEERGYLVKHQNPKFIIQLDPIDGTFLALRGLPGACVAISVFILDSMTLIAAMVGDYYTKDIYWSTGDKSYLNNEIIHPSKVHELSKAYISTCYGKKDRFARILDIKDLVGKVFWFSTTGGMLDMVHVASGQIDAYFDLMLGYKTYDFAAGAFIAQAAGAFVSDGMGKPIKYPRNLNTRCKFIIASTEELHNQIYSAYLKQLHSK